MRASYRGRIAVFAFILAFSAAGMLGIPDADAAVIKSVNIKDNLAQFEIDGPFTYTIYTLDPYRVVADLPQVKAGAFTGKIPSSNTRGITEVSISEDQKATHIEMLLESPGEVKPGLEGNVFSLLVNPVPGAQSAPKADVTAEAEGPPENGEAAPPSPEAQPAPEKKEPLPAAATEITGIEFTQENDRLNIVITGNGELKANVFSLPDRIVMDIPGTELKATLPKEVIAPVKGIRSGEYPDKIRLVIDVRKSVNYEVLAKGSQLVLSMPHTQGAPVAAAKPEEAPEAAPQAAAKPGVPVIDQKQAAVSPSAGSYTGQRISLDFQNADIVPIFMLLGEVSGYNVVVHPSVTGTVTLKLKDVPWNQALDLLLDTFSLAKSVEGNVMKIAPLAQFAQWKQDKEKLKETEERTDPLLQDVIKLNYATAASVSEAINNAKLLSPRGNITPDARMNTLIIKDIQKNLEKIRELVKIMDVAKPQVMIEAQIVEVNSTYAENIGVRWGSEIPMSGGQEFINFAINPPMQTANIPNMSPDSELTPLNPGGTATFRLGTANAAKIQLNIEALETVGKSRKLANPRVLTLDNEAASIQQGTSIPVQTTTAEGTTTTYVNANLNLTVTPRITPEGFIQLKVTAANDSLGIQTSQGFAIDRKNVSTQALVKDGETLVLGGIFTTTESTTDEQIPFLGKIPILGWLFKQKKVTGPNPTELLILITPKIVKETASAS
jgi:type IV pilus assembly protein PilQ